MKKLVYITAILSLSLASCKKDYTCVCTANGLGINIETKANSTKNGAKEWCKSLQNSTETVDGTASPTFPLTCAIK